MEKVASGSRSVYPPANKPLQQPNATSVRSKLMVCRRGTLKRDLGVRC
jgi:hypothetical protein